MFLFHSEIFRFLIFSLLCSQTSGYLSEGEVEDGFRGQRL